jgi:hypothetical protein
METCPQLQRSGAEDTATWGRPGHSPVVLWICGHTAFAPVTLCRFEYVDMRVMRSVSQGRRLAGLLLNGRCFSFHPLKSTVTRPKVDPNRSGEMGAEIDALPDDTTAYTPSPSGAVIRMN